MPLCKCSSRAWQLQPQRVQHASCFTLRLGFQKAMARLLWRLSRSGLAAKGSAGRDSSCYLRALLLGSDKAQTQKLLARPGLSRLK